MPRCRRQIVSRARQACATDFGDAAVDITAPLDEAIAATKARRHDLSPADDRPLLGRAGIPLLPHASIGMANPPGQSIDMAGKVQFSRFHPVTHTTSGGHDAYRWVAYR
jgi:hypothetical protein